MKRTGSPSSSCECENDLVDDWGEDGWGQSWVAVRTLWTAGNSGMVCGRGRVKGWASAVCGRLTEVGAGTGAASLRSVHGRAPPGWKGEDGGGLWTAGFIVGGVKDGLWTAVGVRTEWDGMTGVGGTSGSSQGWRWEWGG